MNTRQPWIFGLAALGLALAAPVQAAPEFLDGAYVVAARERDAFRQERRDARKDERADGRRQRAEKRDAGQDEPQGYGYGYERRQQQQTDEGDRPRGEAQVRARPLRSDSCLGRS